MESTLPSALDGIAVLDLATERAELCGRVLADLGADVLKVEGPSGAQARKMPPYARSGERTDSLYWASVGMGKRSVVFDVADSKDRELFVDRVSSADVLVESFGPGVMAAFGLGYDDLVRVNPPLIYVAITPFGQTGPLASAPASELTIEAASGLLGLQGDRDRPPVQVGYPQAAFHAGVQAAADVLIALNERSHSGRGQFLDVSMQAVMVWTLMNATGFPPNTGGDPPGTGGARDDEPPQLFEGIDLPRLLPCANGYVYVGFGPTGLASATFHRFMGWVERAGECPDPLQDIDWIDWGIAIEEGRLSREQVQSATSVLQMFVGARTKQELHLGAQERRLLLAPINDIADVAADTHLRHRDYWWDVGGRRHPGPFARLSQTPLRAGGTAPQLGASLRRTRARPARKPALSAEGERRPAFDELRVADFSWVGVGPLVGKALADHGATVIRVESGAHLDVLRERAPFKDNVPGVDRSQFMANFNTSKYGLSLDLNTRGGIELARKLASWADVVLESFTPGTMSRRGLDYEALSQGRSDLVMLSTSIRGQTGPERRYGGYGTQGAALAGIHRITGWPDRAPVGPWGAYTDFIAPRYGVAAVAAALYWRSLTGQGQHIDLSQVEAAIHFIEPLVVDYTVNGRVADAPGNASTSCSPHGVYPVAGDERYVAIAVESTEQWRALREQLLPSSYGGHEWDDWTLRVAHAAAIDAELCSALADRDPEVATQELRDAGVPAAVVARPMDLYADTQLAHRGFFVMLNHPVMGPTPYDGLATIFSATPGRLRKAAPCLGEDNQHVLGELLMIDSDVIADYVVKGAVR